MRYLALFAYSIISVALTSPAYAQPYPAVDSAASRNLQSTTNNGMHYVTSGKAGGARIIFVHGTPGSWQAWATYLADASLKCAAELVAVDRPGFGELASQDVLTSLQSQSSYLAPLIESAADKVILVGHSLGGTIAVRAAADFGDKLDGVVIVAASISAKLGGPRWYNRIADVPPVSWLLSDVMRRANDEIMPLASELETLAAKLGNIKIPVTIVHGVDDKLVSIKNTDFAESRLQNAKLRIQRIADAGHFILWEQSELIIQTILDLLDAKECVQRE